MKKYRNAIVKNMINMPSTITIGPHKGAVTHHQLQSITLVNLRIKNVINNSCENVTDTICLVFSMS